MRALLLGLLLTSCAPPLTLDGAACPCTTGWACCEDSLVCVREGVSCPVLPGPVVTPAKVELGQDRIQRFSSADADVTWAIEEGAAGGTIDQTGRYRAPFIVGEYHVLARANGGVTRVTVTVRPLRLSVLAGSSGGASKRPVDGVGQLARLSEPKGLALTGGRLYFSDQQRLRRLDLTSRRVDTIIDLGQRRIPNPPASVYSQRFTQLSVSRADTLLFFDENCAREFSLTRDTLDTFWCGENVQAMTGDETRLVRLGGTPVKLLVIDRATRQSVELLAPVEGFVGVVKLSLRNDLLWLLDHNGTAVRAWNLLQPTTLPVTVVPPTAGKVFIDLEASLPDDPSVWPSVMLLEASGRVVETQFVDPSLRGPTFSPRTNPGAVLAFTAASDRFQGVYVLTPDTIRRNYFSLEELLAGKPAGGRIEVDGVGGGASIVVSLNALATRKDVTWLGSLRSVRRIARDGTTTSIPSDLIADSITVDDAHVWLANSGLLALRRSSLTGGPWQPLPYQPEAPVTFLGVMSDGRIAFTERGKLNFLDGATGELLPGSVTLPAMPIVSLDPAGALFGELTSLSSTLPKTMPIATAINGVQRLDLSTGRLTKVGPDALLQEGTTWLPTTTLASATTERQYALSSEGDQVFFNQGGVWAPLVGAAKRPVVGPGPLPGTVNTIKAVATLDNGDVVLVDGGEHVVLVIE
jgi:hypothetical protein